MASDAFKAFSSTFQGNLPPVASIVNDTKQCDRISGASGDNSIPLPSMFNRNPNNKTRAKRRLRNALSRDDTVKFRILTIPQS